MSVGIVTPKVLAEITTKMCMRLGNKTDTSLPIHVSQKYSSPERMVLDMEKPRRVFTFCPSTPHNSDNIIESLSTQMGPLDVVIDCYIDSDTDISRRRDICEHNSTQYLSVNMTHAGCLYKADAVHIWKTRIYSRNLIQICIIWVQLKSCKIINVCSFM